MNENNKKQEGVEFEKKATKEDSDQVREKVDRDALKKLKSGISKAAEEGGSSKAFRPDPYD